MAVIDISAIQMQVIEDDPDNAIESAVRLIRQCKGSDLIVLPELWNIGFMSFDQYLKAAADHSGKTLAAMKEMARETGAYLHTGSFPHQTENGCYNTSFLLSPEGDVLEEYRKIHLFGFKSRESEILTPGERLCVIRTPLATIGMATCFDLRFPEMFRHMIDLGAELFVVCSAWPYPRLEHWMLLNRARAVENQAIVVSANCTGTNRGVAFVGHSMIVDPWGTVVAACGDDEAIVRTRIDTHIIKDARDRFPGLASRKKWLQKGDIK
jgi:predicted amidohydrolase